MIIELTLKLLKEIFRVRTRILISLGMPILFLGFFSLVFAPQDTTPTLIVGVVNYDEGYESDYTAYIPSEFNHSLDNSLGETFMKLMWYNTSLIIDGLEDQNIELLTYYYEEEDTLIKDIETQSINLGYIIPKNFTEVILSIYNQNYRSENGVYLSELPTDEMNTTVTLLGDPTVSEYQSSSALMQEAFSEYTSMIYGAHLFSSIDIRGGYYDIINTELENDYTVFSEFAGGFIVFVIILNMSSISSILAGEKETGTINRFKLSLTPSYTLFIAVLLTQFVIGTIQIILSAALIHLNGIQLSFGGWMQTFLILQITNINITGLALIAGTLAKTKDDAATATSILSAPLGFLSGAFLPVPEVWIVKSANIQIWDIIPSYHSVQAVNAIFNENQDILELGRPIALLSIMSLIWLAIGLWMYNSRIMKADT